MKETGLKVGSRCGSVSKANDDDFLGLEGEERRSRGEMR
jgi:hypothetical protein